MLLALLVLTQSPVEKTLEKRADMRRWLGPEATGSTRETPLLYQPPSKPCPPARHNGGMTYEVGGPPAKDAGDFSSTQAQVLYVADSGPGVDRVLLLDMQNNCLSQKPEPPWWGGFRPEPAVFEWRKKGAAPAGPIAVARGLAAWSNHGVLLFANGWIATAGSATSQGTHPVLRLPPGKIPTSLAVTPRNEMALVTVIDVKEKKGQLAVVALEAFAPDFAHDWHQRVPLIPNQGSFSDMKLLGFVDLPLLAPSAVSASCDGGGRLEGSDGNVTTPSRVNLDDPGTRKRLAGGYLAGSGFAVVLSREEEKAAFVDLQPLLAAVREAFAGDVAKLKGPLPLPTPAGVVDVPRPVSVLARPGGGEHARVYVGSEDGVIRSFRRSGTLAGQVAAGKNPVWLAYKGGRGGPEFGFIAVCRGERSLQWITFGPGDGKITRELKDRRLQDPVYAEIADTHGIETQLVTVADFRGRKIVNYRCSPVVFATNGGARYGCGPKGKDEFECGGVLPLPGYPFAVCGTNVN